MKNKIPSLGFTVIGTLMGCLALPVALPAQSASGYWKISGTPEVTERYESRSENGWEYKIVSWGPDNVRFNFRDAISGKYTGLTFKWSGPATIVPGEVVPVSVSYEVTGPKVGGFTARFYIPGRNATADFLGIDLLQNSVPTAQVINTKAKAPPQSGDREMRYRANLSGRLSYEVTVQYRWMEGTPPPSSVTPPPGGGPTVTPPASTPGTTTTPSSHPHVVATADGNRQPAPGYRWVSDAPGDFRVIWSPGKRHTQHPNVVAGATEGRWEPAPGYRWVSDAPGDMRVVPKDGTDQTGTSSPATQRPVTPPRCAQESVIYTNNNIAGVQNGPTQQTRFQLTQPTLVTYLLSYHWNNGRGQPPGTIGLQHQDGTRYGPWPAGSAPGSGGAPNAYWIARPQVVLKPGTYTVLDSHAASWAQNAQSNGQGIVEVKGCGGR